MGYDATVIIVTYNSRKYIDLCIDSVIENDPLEIIVIDNCSSDGTPDFINKHYRDIKLITNTKNLGYGAGNNLGAKYAKGKYVIFLNPDTIIASGCLKELLLPLKESKIITTPKILLYDGSAINTCGNINHFTGLTFTRGLGEDKSKYSRSGPVSGFSGCCFALQKTDFLGLGGFDEAFFLYNEDSDLSWRALVNGFRILFVHTAIVKHDYSLTVSPEKLYHLEKGRYIILRKYLSKKRDILLLLPSLLTAELLVFGYATRFGWKGLRFKFRGIREGLGARVNLYVGDNTRLFHSLESEIPVNQLAYGMVDNLAKRAANIIFKLNFNQYRKVAGLDRG